MSVIAVNLVLQTIKADQVSLAGVVVIAVIVWWFWLSKPKA